MDYLPTLKTSHYQEGFRIVPRRSCLLTWDDSATNCRFSFAENEVDDRDDVVKGRHHASGEETTPFLWVLWWIVLCILVVR